MVNKTIPTSIPEFHFAKPPSHDELWFRFVYLDLFERNAVRVVQLGTILLSRPFAEYVYGMPLQPVQLSPFDRGDAPVLTWFSPD